MKLPVRKRMLSFSDMDFYCGVMTRSVADYSPEIVVSIRCGGWYVGKIVSGLMGVDHLSITVRRIGDAPSGRISLWAAMSQVFIETIRRPMLVPYVVAGLMPIVSMRMCGKRVLLVDDAVHSGDTIRVAMDYVMSFQPANVVTAVIGNVHSIAVVNHWVLDGWYCYPWSKLSPDYEKFRMIMESELTGGGNRK